MWPRSALLTTAFAVLAGLSFHPAIAQQQVTVSSPHTAVSDSFYEHMGTSWGAQGKNWFFQFGPPGNPNNAAPPFGGFSPSAGANVGFGFNGGGINGGFLGNFSQGSRRSFTSVTPSVTVPNGGTGMIMDTSVSPFVMGYVPIVGGYPMVAVPAPVQPMIPSAAYVTPGPVSGHPGVLQALQNVSRDKPLSEAEVDQARLPEREDEGFHLAGPASTAPQTLDADEERFAMTGDSSASRPVMGVEEAKRLREAEASEQDVQAQRFLERGRHAQADGKLNVARTYYRMAASRASPQLRQEVLNLLASLPSSDSKPR